MAKITGVTFKQGGKVYYFAPGKEDYAVGTDVIVETSRGTEYGTVVISCAEVADERLNLPLKPVLRAATEKDRETRRKNSVKRAEAMKTVAAKIKKFDLDMKLIDGEISFDGTKAIFYYSSPRRVDFRELVKELSQSLKMRIELRQLGVREEIKMIGGLGPCGRECCCAGGCTPEVKKVTVKMAKAQGLSLNPTKISGLCGKLMCCIAYEEDYYSEAGKKVPKLGSEVSTPDGKGTVVNVNMLKMQVRVRIEDKDKDFFTLRDYPVGEIKFKSHRKEEEEEKEN